jgi:hypothetical protein
MSSDPPGENEKNDTDHRPSTAQVRIDTAIRVYERAEAEVDRLCGIIERAAEALKQAREEKRLAQIELDEASKSVSNGGVANYKTRGLATADELRNSSSKMSQMDNVGRDILPNRSGSQRDYSEDEAEYNEVYSDDEESSSESDSSSQSSDEEAAPASNEDPNDFDMGNEALDQIRYRLQTAKIDPVSTEGTKLLDELLVRFQRTDEPIDVNLVNRFIDELLNVKIDNNSPMSSGNSEYESFSKVKDVSSPAQAQKPGKYPRIRINRGGKVLGWYEGQLDSRGYAREGVGSMYYDAGHECHGVWQNDEMIGRGTYKWSDGHQYDGEWEGGKRHGLGRFIRPDGVILYGRYEKGHHRGEGVRWSADRKEAQLMVDGVPKKSVSLAIAQFLALKLGFEDVPPPPFSS